MTKENRLIKNAFLRALMETISPTGQETAASEIWRREARILADEVKGDFMGNSIAILNPKGKTKIMIAGHIDEIGIQITNIDKDGFLHFQPLGGFDLQVLPGQRVILLGLRKKTIGVVGRKAIHLQDPEERKKVAKYENLWIDIGARDKKNAEEHVEVGSVGVLDYGGPIKLLNNLLIGRAFDDRIGAFIILEAMRRIKELGGIKAALYSVATTQEEIGALGAMTSCSKIEPHIAIAVDVGFATDTPTLESARKKMNDIKMGHGPIIARGPNINPKLFKFIKKIAIENVIPYQVVAFSRQTGTDARSFQINGSGAATGLISIPNRYMHSPCEMVHQDDVWNAIELFARVILAIDNHKQFVI